MIPPLSAGETFVTFVALALGIMLWRFLPFALFSRRERLPAAILHLGKTLPHASMTLLLVYCLKDAPLLSWPNGIPELLGIAFTAALHLWRKNVLLSIAGGTVFYMALVQTAFA